MRSLVWQRTAFAQLQRRIDGVQSVGVGTRVKAERTMANSPSVWDEKKAVRKEISKRLKEMDGTSMQQQSKTLCLSSQGEHLAIA